MSKARRIQRVLAERNYNNDLLPSHLDYGFKSEEDMHLKIAQLNAISQYGINKEAFIAPMVQGVKNAFTAGQAAAKAAGTSGVMGGLKSVGTNAVQGVKNMGTGAVQSVKNMGTNIQNTYQTGVNTATQAGTSGVMGGIKSLGQAAWNNPYGQAAIVSGGIGGITGAMGPVQEGESRLGNIAKGVAGGAVTGVALTGLQRGLTAAGNKYFNGAAPGAAAPVAPSAPAQLGYQPT
jgi:hypothetical protein